MDALFAKANGWPERPEWQARLGTKNIAKLPEFAKAGPGIHASVPPGPVIDLAAREGAAAFTAMSAAKPGVPINAMTVIALASLVMKSPKHLQINTRPDGGLLPSQHSEEEKRVGTLAPTAFAERIDLW